MNIWPIFAVKIPGKWVLAGEHSVLRGGSALALPHPEFSLELSFNPGEDSLSVYPSQAQYIIDELLSAIQKNLSHRLSHFTAPRGELRIASSIPVGAGLGSSAALCVALTRWVCEPLGIDESEQFEFARSLEHRFHGKSSGMDVAAAALGHPILFSMSAGAKTLALRRLPRFSFHDTKLRASTHDCIKIVEHFRSKNPPLSMQVDDAMDQATVRCLGGLTLYNRSGTDAPTHPDESEKALVALSDGMAQAQRCFEEWGLVPKSVGQLVEDLLSQGARAAKLTGAGGGGFVVALWSA